MKRIGIISDTHSFLDPKIIKHFNTCDEIWHAGDFGFNKKIKHFIETYDVKGVYGNIDGQEIRKHFPKTQKFTCEKLKVLMTHIGGYPNRYQKDIENEIKIYNPDLYICGHSHILKIMYDEKYKLIHINPGAAGKEGFHKVRTIVLLNIDGTDISNVRVIELGKRTNLT